MATTSQPRNLLSIARFEHRKVARSPLHLEPRQDRCLREIERHQEADKSYADEGVQLLELARKAQTLFDRQEPREKRRLLDFLLSNCTWEDGEVVALQTTL
jgi:hypothetical protein